ncbi:hypothetical protein ACIQF5_20640 [Streptomyces goshikiensis]|uniref:hypothetical protein n=1 Tax=Streptomyces goshikiensis TaxID=1942 RepID=UPI003817EE26
MVQASGTGCPGLGVFEQDFLICRHQGDIQELHVGGGEVRRICDLFGPSIDAVLRYVNTLEHPDLTSTEATVELRGPEGCLPHQLTASHNVRAT